MPKLINLTPHDVSFIRMPTEEEVVCMLATDPGYSVSPITVVIPSSGVARCEQTLREEFRIDGIPVMRSEMGAAVGLPPEDDDHVYIVSQIVCQASPDRLDVFFPADLVRDATGKIVGCRSLGRVGFPPVSAYPHCATCANSGGEHCGGPTAVAIVEEVSGE